LWACAGVAGGLGCEAVCFAHSDFDHGRRAFPCRMREPCAAACISRALPDARAARRILLPDPPELTDNMDASPASKGAGLHVRMPVCGNLGRVGA